jgi:hypothetical protein
VVLLTRLVVLAVLALLAAVVLVLTALYQLANSQMNPELNQGQALGVVIASLVVGVVAVVIRLF